MLAKKYTVKTVTSKKLVLAKNGRQFEINAGENSGNLEDWSIFEGGKEKSISSGLELSIGVVSFI